MKKIFRYLEALLKAAIYVALPVIAFVMITSRTPFIYGIRSFVVLTGSMEPSLPVGTVVMTQRATDYNIKDVIAFSKLDKTITHRIVDVKTQNNIISYRTKGDANNVGDIDPVRKDNVLGKEIFFIPYLGYLIIFIKTIPGFLTLIVLPAIIYIVLEIFYIRREILREFEKRYLRNDFQDLQFQ